MKLKQLLNTVFDPDKVVEAIGDFEKELTEIFGYAKTDKNVIEVYRIHPDSTTFIFELDKTKKLNQSKWNTSKIASVF